LNISRFFSIESLLACFLLAGVSCGDSAPTAQKIYFVPIGEVRSLRLADLVAYYKQRYDLAIRTLTPIGFEPVVVDERRRQLIAEELVELMKRRYPEHARSPQAILIGITEGDMHIRQFINWEFALAFRESKRFAVVSSAHMDPVNFGYLPDDELLQTRLRKMITRNIGILYYKLPQKSDRRSVMYGPILGVDDLDSVGEDF
jgi:predicted Zn-dependent protease